MFNYNPYQFNQEMKIIKVNGENGARAYNMPPNSEALLLDETAPLVWLAVTDGAGYKTVTPYTIEKYEPKTYNIADIETRLERLEELLNESYASAVSNEQSEPKCDSSENDEPEPAIPPIRSGKSRKNTG